MIKRSYFFTISYDGVLIEGGMVTVRSWFSAEDNAFDKVKKLNEERNQGFFISEFKRVK